MRVGRWCEEPRDPTRGRSRSESSRSRRHCSPLPAAPSAISRSPRRRRLLPTATPSSPAGFACLYSYFPPSSHPPHAAPDLPPPSASYLLSSLARRCQILDHLTVPLDSSRIVDLHPENHGGGGNSNDFAIEDLVTNTDEVSLVIRPADHADGTLLCLNDSLQLHLIDEESWNSGRTLARLNLGRGTDERLKRVAAALRIVPIGFSARGVLEDLFEGLLDGCAT